MKNKKENFSEWFIEVIEKAELADYSSVSGCMIFRPYCYAIWEMIQRAVDEKIKKMNVQNAYFPLFIPESLLKKEATHLKGFSPEVAWVTHAGKTKLGEKLAIRPTSETIMYESFSKWIRSWRDLPLKINQWNNVVRWEFKHPVALLRTREFLWNEGHTVFASKEEAEKEKDIIMKMYKEILEEYMALYGIEGKKTEKEKFAGAVYTVAIELFLPNGKAIQGPDFHFDGQNFSKAFDIKFLNKEGKKEYAWQNTWAITTRMIGIMIAIHGDDNGLVLPPKIAPIQIIIIPIFKKREREKILKEAKKIKKKLEKNYRVEIDERQEYTPGWKFNEWELRGVPIRIEIGQKEIAKAQIVVVRRDNGKKQKIKIKDLKKIKFIFDSIHKNLYNKSKKFLQDSISKTETWQQFLEAIKNKKIALASFCNETACEEKIKEKSGASSMCIKEEKEKGKLQCVHCKKPAKVLCYFAKTY